MANNTEKHTIADVTILCRSGNRYGTTLRDPTYPPAALVSRCLPLPDCVSTDDEADVRFALALSHFTLLGEETLRRVEPTLGTRAAPQLQQPNVSIDDFASDLAFHLWHWSGILNSLVECREELNSLGYSTPESIADLRAALDARVQEYCRQNKTTSCPLARELLSEDALWHVSWLETYDQMLQPTVSALADFLADYVALRMSGIDANNIAMLVTAVHEDGSVVRK
jgi:hypothetical protein